MRKKLLNLLLVLPALCLCQLAATANDIEPGKEFYNATRVTKAIVADGNLTEWVGVPVLADPKFAVPKGTGAAGKYVLFEEYNGGTWSGPDDQTSAVQVAWDDNNVYFGFVVTDDYHENAANSAWNGDSVQLMIASADRAERVALYNYALGGVEGAVTDVIVNHEAGPGASDAAAETTAVVTRNATTKKTIYEIKLPAAALGLTAPLKAGTTFGLGMAINDGDELTPGQKGWGGLGAHSIVFGKTAKETALITLSATAAGADRFFFSAINPGPDSFTFRATDKGTSIVAPATAKLTIDKVVVALTSKKTGDATDFTYTAAKAFAEGSDHTYSIEVKDTLGTTLTDAGVFKTANKPVVLPAGTLFIEGEDFNFGKGQWIKNKPIGMTGAYPGGDYQDLGDGLDGTLGDGTDFGIDYFEVSASNAQAIYRPNTGAEAGKPNGPAGVSRGSFDVTVNHTLGWNDAGDWFNYTRAFPATNPNQLYKVYARTATDAGQTRNTQLALVTSDATKANQTLQVLGTFNGPATGGWDTWPADGSAADALLPLRDAAGSDVLVKLSGVVTLRYTFLPGASDLDYIGFVPAGSGVVLPPKITSLKPANSATGQSDSPTIEALIEDGDLSVATASIRLDGTAVTATVTKAGKVTKVSYTPTTRLAAGSAHTATFVYTDTASPPVSRTNNVSFTVTFTPLPAGTLFIEAEDFNFSKGQWITDKPIGMTGPYAGGAFAGKGNGLNGALGDGSDFGIDYFEVAADSAQAIYRPGTGVEAGKTNGPAGFNRGSFDVAVNHAVGWNDAGDWYNYTRVFPTNTYKVYARTATDVGQDRNTQLSRVTSDPTKGNQTEAVLGTFKGPATGGWDTWPDAGTTADALIPLRDAAGKDVVLALGGQTTLRYTFLPGASDVDYIAFIPAAAPVVVPPPLSVPATAAVGPALTVPGGSLKGEYWKRGINTIPTDGATNPTNRIDKVIGGFGTASGTFQATKFVYLGNDLTPVKTWLTNDSASFVGTADNLDDGAFRFSGFINIAAPGTVSLGTTSDDGSRIKIGGVDIINNDSGHGDATVDTNVVFTAAGLYPIEVTYFNGDWTSDGTGAKLNHSGNLDPSVHGGANFRLRVAGADVTAARAAMFYSALPPSAPGLAGTFSLSGPLTDDASSGVSTLNTYTHAVSGGSAATVNGVVFEELTPAKSPANLAWVAPDGKSQVLNNNNVWVPAAGGVTSTNLIALLRSFTYSGGGDKPGSFQTFTLSGLTVGTTYDTRLYIRVWDKAGLGRLINFTMTHGAQADTYEGLAEDRPADVLGNKNPDSAYYLNYHFKAQGTTLEIKAAVPGTVKVGNGSYHMYALSNQVGSEPVPNTLQNGLTAYWNFDGNLLDSAKAFHGTARGTSPLTYVDGKGGFGKAAKFNGTNFVEITGSSNTLAFANGSLSIAGWFRVDTFDKDWQALIAKGEGTTWRIARRGAGQTIAYAGGVGEGADDVPVITNGWHHFVAVTDATGAKFGTALYVDGVIRGINTNKAVLAAGALNLLIGENPGALNRQFKGALDDIALWNRVLAADEVSALYNGGAGRPLGGLLPPPAPPTTQFSIGLNFGANEAGGNLTNTTSVAGVPGAAQANWNNLSGPNGTNVTTVAIAGGTASKTSALVTWVSNGTWASGSRGEPNGTNFARGTTDHVLMEGYLDTGAPTTTAITVANIPVELTSGGYDVYVYALGGVAGRGGAYRVLDAATKAVLKDYVRVQSPASPTTYIPVPTPAPGSTNYAAGNYIVFSGLKATGIIIEATTAGGLGFGAPARAPVNAVQLIASAAPATASATVKGGLVAYWNFDGNLSDSIKSAHGTARGTTPLSFVDGKSGFGKAAHFNGTNFVEITGSSNTLQFANGNLSIAGWFRVDAFDKSWQALLAKGENSSYRIARRGDGNTIAYAGGVGEGANDVPAITNGWHHFVAVTDGTGAKFGTALYIDGVIRGINTNKAVLEAGAFNLFIGENPQALNRQFKGALDDIALWNRVLTADEVSVLYKGGTGTPLSEILAPPSGPTVVKVQVLGIGAGALLGGPLTDPDGNGLDALGGASSPTWDWAGITASIEPDFEGGENSFNIFDHKVGGGNDKWCCDDPIPGKPVWVAVQFRQPVSLTHFTVTSGNDTPGRDPTDWAIQGSNDGITYTDIYHFVGNTTPWGDVRNEVVKFTLPSAAPAYAYIRYIAYETPATLHQLNEIEYFGTTTGSAAVVPVELGQTVNGFQDDFTGATRDPNWQAFGPGGDRYDQGNGVLYVSPNIGDPNHLLYMKPGYSNDVQEVLARVRVTAFGPLHDYPRGGVAVGVQTNTADVSRGLNLHFRDSTQDNVPGRQFKLLDDARAWGPAGLRTNIPPQTTPGWTNNVWYWMRLSLAPKGDNTNTLFAKAWVADGVTPEPKDWQLKWTDAAIPKPVRKGFAGIAGSSVDGNGNGLAHLEVDYILIKAAGLPQINVNFKGTGPAPTPVRFSSITKSGGKLFFDWVGAAGALEQADTVAGPWTAVPAGSAGGIVTPTGAGKFYRLRP